MEEPPKRWGLRLAGEYEIGEVARRDPIGHATLPDQGVRADLTPGGHALQVMKGDRSGMGPASGIKP